MTDYKPIETFYNGYKFRSKNEAKWAMFFDKVGIRYEYEPVTFWGWSKQQYKPDFYLPDYDKYVEVKSNTNAIHEDKMAQKINGAIDFQTTPVSNGLLLLGSFPFDVRSREIALHTTWLFWYKGVCCAQAIIKQRLGDGKVHIIFSENGLDCGDPLPPTASVDIHIYRDYGWLIYDAIEAVNKYFNSTR